MSPAVKTTVRDDNGSAAGWTSMEVPWWMVLIVVIASSARGFTTSQADTPP
jgi:hypothetical protein